MNKLIGSALASIACLAIAPAQGESPGTPSIPTVGRVLPHLLMLPKADNSSGQVLELAERLVHFRGATFVQIEFGRAHLPRGSHLEVISLRDGSRQILRARHAQNGSLHSAYFNGDSVVVRLFAGPNTTGTTAAIKSVAIGDVQVANPTTICGTVDDRVFTADKRVARLVLRRGSKVGYCTGFLIGSTCQMSTAGHCLALSGLTLVTAQFDVPLSSSNGSPVHPPASKQYNWNSNSETRAYVSGAKGNDWAVFHLASNGTNRHAGQNQGQWFNFHNAPAVNSSIRITGNGSAGQNKRLNLATHTSTGPLTNATGSMLCYRTDTTGGNSGSPVIDAKTNNCIGVHTHGGCTTTGGCNSGTNQANSGYAAARARLASCGGRPGAWVSYGAACRGTGKGPAICAQLNGSGGALNSQTLANEYCYAVKFSSAATVLGFELFTRAMRSNASMTCAVYREASTGVPSRNSVARGTMAVTNTTKFHRVMLPSSLGVRAGETIWISQYDASTILAASLASGSPPPAPTFWRRPAGAGGAWRPTGIVRFPSWRVICAGGAPGATPVLSNSGLPVINSPMTVHLSHALGSSLSVFLLGGSRSNVPIPATTQCFQLVTPTVILGGVTDAKGVRAVQLWVPGNPSLVGRRFQTQWAIVDSRANALGVVTSNGGEGTIGS